MGEADLATLHIHSFFNLQLMAHLLYVEDDENLAFITKENLELAGYTITHYDNGANAAAGYEVGKFDLAILDVMLPDLDGFELAKKIRAIDQHIPILFLTARGQKDDRITGLKLGADDYISKPFSLEELTLRIQVFLRRSKILADVSSGTDDKMLKVGNLKLDAPNLELHTPEGVTEMTQREAAVLAYLGARPNQVIRREVILKEIWGDDDYFMGRSLDVFISRIRKYLAVDPTVKLDTLHGVGFRLTVK